MTKTFIVATGNIDSDGDRFILDGIQIPGKVLLTKEFDHTNPIGHCHVVKDENTLKATADIPEEFIGSYPAIGFQILKSEKKGNIRLITEAKLHYVGLCANKNVDSKIKRLSDQ